MSGDILFKTGSGSIQQLGGGKLIQLGVGSNGLDTLNTALTIYEVSKMFQLLKI